MVSSVLDSAWPREEVNPRAGWQDLCPQMRGWLGTVISGGSHLLHSSCSFEVDGDGRRGPVPHSSGS